MNLDNKKIEKEQINDNSDDEDIRIDNLIIDRSVKCLYKYNKTIELSELIRVLRNKYKCLVNIINNKKYNKKYIKIQFNKFKYIIYYINYNTSNIYVNFRYDYIVPKEYSYIDANGDNITCYEDLMKTINFKYLLDKYIPVNLNLNKLIDEEFLLFDVPDNAYILIDINNLKNINLPIDYLSLNKIN